MSDCQHWKSELRVRTIRGGGVQLWDQCVSCLKALGGGPKSQAGVNLDKLPQFEDETSPDVNQMGLWD